MAVRIEEPELCPRYTARLVRGVKIGPSPDWLRSTSEKVGLRSISNVVDVTNSLCWRWASRCMPSTCVCSPAAGHPTIIVRRAAEGEKFVTLDGKERTLTDQIC